MKVKECQLKKFTVKVIHTKTRVQIHYVNVYISKTMTLSCILTFFNANIIASLILLTFVSNLYNINKYFILYRVVEGCLFFIEQKQIK